MPVQHANVELQACLDVHATHAHPCEEFSSRDEGGLNQSKYFGKLAIPVRDQAVFARRSSCSRSNRSSVFSIFRSRDASMRLSCSTSSPDSRMRTTFWTWT